MSKGTLLETDNPKLNLRIEPFMKRLLLLSFFLAISTDFVAAQKTDKTVKVSGVVVAVDEITPFGNSTYHNMSSETFVVRVESPKALALQSRYIIISFQRRLDDPYLPSDLFESSKKGRFQVSRSPNCDTSFNKIISVIDVDSNAPIYVLPKRLSGAESELLPLEENFPCYVLKPGDIKSLKRIV